ncbi:uncharacterized protein LOC132911845 [Bombus pascuorum]|uniref:uncharacterized protein LOC132911845 n=1 Tax=Bombus pascuorum TaxID=65598 RepID=UPI00298E63FE|nr:uncharacterized protein LOC132911845 [Bombus pascuorum]
MAAIPFKEAYTIEHEYENDSSSEVNFETNDGETPNTPDLSDIEEAILNTDLFAFDPSKCSFCKDKSIVNILNVGESGTLEFQTEIKNGVYGITLWPESTDDDYEKLLDEMDIVIPETHEWSNRRPKIGDLVFGKRYDGDWIRGYIISVLPHLKLAMIDEAKVVHVSNIASCNKPISDMYAFSGVCELSDTTHKFVEGDGAQFKVTGRTVNGEPNEFDIKIINKDYEIKATVKPWVPMVEQMGVACGEVPDECEVIVTGYRNHLFMYIRPADAMGTARYNFIMDTVAQIAERSPILEDPNVAQSAIALAPDGKYYRGYITKVDEYRVQIMYHDLGRREFVDRKTLRVYPEFLKKLGYSITKVYLRDVPKDIPPFMPIVRILDDLVENEVRLIH